jgi:phytoene dehydrogenase-like protein
MNTFESEITKAHLAGSAIIGTALGPCSPGSAYVLLHHYMGEVRWISWIVGLLSWRYGVYYKSNDGLFK